LPFIISDRHTANHSATNPGPLTSATWTQANDACRYVIRLYPGKWTGTAAGSNEVGGHSYIPQRAMQPRVSKHSGISVARRQCNNCNIGFILLIIRPIYNIRYYKRQEAAACGSICAKGQLQQAITTRSFH